MSVLKTKSEVRKKKGVPNRVPWYYVYTPETGVEPLTVSLLLREAHLGMLMTFDNKVAIEVEYIDISNQHYPFLIGRVVEGSTESLHLYIETKDEDNIQGTNLNKIKHTPMRRHQLRVWWGYVCSYCRRQLRRAYRNRTTEGAVNGNPSVYFSI